MDSNLKGTKFVRQNTNDMKITVTGQEPEFKPLTFSITLNTKAEADSFFALINCTSDDIREGFGKSMNDGFSLKDVSIAYEISSEIFSAYYKLRDAK